MKNRNLKMNNLLKIVCASLVFSIGIFAQVNPPAPSAPKSVKIPAVQEITLKNGLKVAVIERKNVPLVTVQLLVKSGAQNESMDKAGLADMTASLLTKGTAKRSATDIAEQIEFLGGSINTGAGWTPGYRMVLILHDVEGYTHEEIARMLHIDPGTSKSQLSRARAAMRRALSVERGSANVG
jgi:zinc protease